jgi:hypothetical protein
MNATLSPADALDRALGNVNRNLASFRRKGGEQERLILEASRNHATWLITGLGQARVNAAGYQWFAAPAATLNAAMHKHAVKWRAAHPRKAGAGFVNPVLVEGGAL